MDIMRDSGFAGRAGNTDQTKVAGGVSVISGEKFDFGAGQIETFASCGIFCSTFHNIFIVTHFLKDNGEKLWYK